jgi:hypothetical protein
MGTDEAPEEEEAEEAVEAEEVDLACVAPMSLSSNEL